MKFARAAKQAPSRAVRDHDRGQYQPVATDGLVALQVCNGCANAGAVGAGRRIVLGGATNCDRARLA
jgi:hypothetical protein